MGESVAEGKNFLLLIYAETSYGRREKKRKKEVMASQDGDVNLRTKFRCLSHLLTPFELGTP